MTSSFYDVVLIGTRLSSLLAGALLAKRGFRVLLLGQDVLPATYRSAERVWPRRPFTLLPANTPIVRRTLSELALYQIVRRRMITADPTVQVVLPKHRVDLTTDPEAMEREIEREFPEVKRPVQDLHRNVLRTCEELDRITAKDLVWPPETFLERREFARATSQLSQGRRGQPLDPFVEFAEDHDFRDVVRVPSHFSTDLDPNQLDGLGPIRLYGSWLSGAAKLEGGEAWLRRAIEDKIQTYSGEIRREERVEQILVKRGTARGVRLSGTGEEIGASFVLVASPVDELLEIVPDRSTFEQVFERLGEPQARYYRYTLNLVVDAVGVPEGMGRDVFYVGSGAGISAAERTLRIDCHEPDEEGERLLCVEALMPRRGVEDVPGYLDDARERVLQSLRGLIPFLDRHLLYVDSPHDGRDTLRFRDGALLQPHRPWSRGPSSMDVVHGYPVRGALGLCAMPVRTPIRRLLLCNQQIVPALGLEGLFLGAWSAARLVTKTDRKKERMRRGLWTKVEF